MLKVQHISELSKTQTLKLLRQDLVIEYLEKMLKDQKDLQIKIENEIKQEYKDSLHDTRGEFFIFTEDFSHIIRTQE